jgi:hypothetical protein
LTSCSRNAIESYHLNVKTRKILLVKQFQGREF